MKSCICFFSMICRGRERVVVSKGLSRGEGRVEGANLVHVGGFGRVEVVHIPVR